LSFEFVRRAEELSAEEAERMTAVSAVPGLCDALTLAGELLAMTRGASKVLLSDWRARAEASGIRLVQSFAEALGADAAAIQAALSTDWSNGPTEGHGW
jgi:transposase